MNEVDEWLLEEATKQGQREDAERLLNPKTLADWQHRFTLKLPIDTKAWRCIVGSANKETEQ